MEPGIPSSMPSIAYYRGGNTDRHRDIFNQFSCVCYYTDRTTTPLEAQDSIRYFHCLQISSFTLKHAQTLPISACGGGQCRRAEESAHKTATHLCFRRPPSARSSTCIMCALFCVAMYRSGADEALAWVIRYDVNPFQRYPSRLHIPRADAPPHTRPAVALAFFPSSSLTLRPGK